jgi:hypothetical protein
VAVAFPPISILAVVLALYVTGLSFAEFEIDLGLFGGHGNASAAGFTLRLGYLSPALQTKAEEPKDYRWCLLLDGGFGIQLPFLFGTDERLFADHREFTDKHEYSDEVNGLGVYSKVWFNTPELCLPAADRLQL